MSEVVNISNGDRMEWPCETAAALGLNEEGDI